MLVNKCWLGPQDYSFWDNMEFQALTARIDREIDPAKRLPLVQQAEAIMEQDPPLLPSRVSIRPPISAFSTSCDWIRSGSTRRGPRRIRRLQLRVWWCFARFDRR